MIQAIVFDADDTLYTIRHSVGFHYQQYFERYGYTGTAEEINEIIYRIWYQFLEEYTNKENGYKTSPEQERELWKIFTQRVLHTHAPQSKERDNNQLIGDIYDHFTLPESREVRAETYETLQYCREQGYITAVLTNNDQRTQPLFQSLNLDQYFSKIFCACDIGYKKPSRKCFDAVRDELNIPPENILYIGDSYEQDYLGSQNAGWQSILLGTKEEAEHRIEKIEELRMIL